jgi:antirestriction protein
VGHLVSARIFIADLAAYNAGYLHGKWIDLDASMTVDDLYAEIKSILAEGTRLCRETLSVHEEWAIHDYEGFGPIKVGEYDALETVLAHVQRMGDTPGKYYAWLEDGRDPEEFDPDLVNGPSESESDDG